ncbi:cbb3-type cytochrome c oxidase N-terminal domain-containing protein [Catalinimonas niigatensis]|uniref:cbb3-type cytochrome c oxidase N-terminal domain-containing protein n=1 Tax=Catalinimonas niigatensis TaxID=1397264 RepID=UPI002664E6E4|nr:cbb3-type cytochrome c oxidase N-terminal domain-containing protein [Catalinimonas niigatensis]WPP52088.1 cbb3-type cytochrome c oxidase N-terminal domain-containing protein [Catalinimonas niigatensis]
MKRLLQLIKPALKMWLVLSLLPVSAMAQNTASQSSFWEANAQEILVWGILALEIIMLLVVITMFIVVKIIANKVLQPEVATAVNGSKVTAEQEVDKTLWERILTRWNDAVPVEREKEIMTDHEYDGIVELDNNLPPWWKAMFYLTIIFSVVYLLHFHVFDTGDLQGTEYEKEMAEAKAQVDAYLATSANNIDESNVTFVDAEDRLTNGQTLYVQKCSPCHGQAGEGGVGPNLTDQHWIHGGSIEDIFRTIKNGVPAKGMIPWNGQLTPVEMQDISSFIITLEGSNPPNGKEPQGELYEREEMALK